MICKQFKGKGYENEHKREYLGVKSGIEIYFACNLSI